MRVLIEKQSIQVRRRQFWWKKRGDMLISGKSRKFFALKIAKKFIYFLITKLTQYKYN